MRRNKNLSNDQVIKYILNFLVLNLSNFFNKKLIAEPDFC